MLTESVTNIVGRADLLAAFGVLAGLLCYARAVRGRRTRARSVAVGACWRPAASRSSPRRAVWSILAAVFLYDIVLCRRSPLPTRAARYLAAGLPVAVFLLARGQVLANLPRPLVPYTDNPLSRRRFLDGAPHRNQGSGQISCGCCFGRRGFPAIIPTTRSRCFPGAWAAGKIGRRFSPWQYSAAASILAADLLPPVEAGVFLHRLLFRRRRAHREPVADDRHYHGRTRAVSAVDGVCRLSGLGRLVRLTGGFARDGRRRGWRLRRCWRQFAWRSAAGRSRAISTGTTSEACGAAPRGRAPRATGRINHLANALASPPANAFDAAGREAGPVPGHPAAAPIRAEVAAAYATAGFCYRVKGDSLGPDGGAAWYRKSLDTLLEGQKVDQACDRELARRNRLEGKLVGPTLWVPLYLELGRTFRALGQYRNALDALDVRSPRRPAG